MKSIVGAMVVAGALLVPGAADAALVRDLSRTVITQLQPTAKDCTSTAGFTSCQSMYGPVTSQCGQGSGLGFGTSSCSLSVGVAAVGCSSSTYGSSRGTGDSAGCGVTVGDDKLACADSSTSYQSDEQRSLGCNVPGLPAPISVPLDPAFP